MNAQIDTSLKRAVVKKEPPIVPETFAYTASFYHGADTGIRSVYGFYTYKNDSRAEGLSKLCSDKEVLIGITRTCNQDYAEKSLAKEGWTHLLDFSGNGGTALTLWIKDREGDKLAQVGPEIPTLTCKIEDECVIERHSQGAGFPACCGAFVHNVGRVISYKRMPNLRFDKEDEYAPGCHRTGPVSYLNLEAVNVEETTAVSNLMDIGFVPIYKYSKVDGTAMFLMAKQPPHHKGALLIQGKKKTSLTVFIKQLHNIKD